MTNPQQHHYETIHDPYVSHYYDAPSMAYRRRFLFEPLLRGIDLSGRRVAELACGSGHNALVLQDMFPGISIEGFDISESACCDYRRLVGAPAHQVDLALPFEGGGRFDAALVIGGLHHCVNHLDATLRNAASMIRPAGLLLMIEPNSRFLLQAIRDLWYRHDRYFHAETERALDPAALVQSTRGRFVCERLFFAGGPAYFLIANSLVTRIPLRLKPIVAAPLFGLERAWHLLPGQRPFAAFGAVWRRTNLPATDEA